MGFHDVGDRPLQKALTEERWKVQERTSTEFISDIYAGCCSNVGSLSFDTSMTGEVAKRHRRRRMKRMKRMKGMVRDRKRRLG